MPDPKVHMDRAGLSKVRSKELRNKIGSHFLHLHKGSSFAQFCSFAGLAVPEIVHQPCISLQ